MCIYDAKAWLVSRGVSPDMAAASCAFWQLGLAVQRTLGPRSRPVFVWETVEQLEAAARLLRYFNAAAGQR